MRSVTLALVAAGMLVAGCGGGDDSGGDGVASLSDDSEGESAQDDQAATEEELLDWVECMRDHGADIPDPTVDENGDLVIDGPVAIEGPGPGGGEGEGEEEEPPGGDSADGSDGSGAGGEFDGAFDDCGRPPEGAFSPPSEEEQQAMQDAAVEFAQCMRDEGIEDFPDPDFSDMGPGAEPQERSTDEDETGQTDGGGDDGGPTVVLGPFGEIDMDDPEVAAAFEACQDVMAESMPGGRTLPPSDEGGADGGSEGGSEGGSQG